jgi:predicted porin
MNKKVMAVAVAGVFAGPGVALAQKSTVEIYGRANLGFSHYQSKGATAGPTNDLTGRFRVYDGSSRVGFRGTEDLGSGLRAIFQIETGVNVDNGSNTGQGAQANASTGFWASRDSFVGLDSNFGRLTFGRQSIYWANGVNAQFAANYVDTEIPWTNGTQLGRISLQGAAVARVSNTVQYTSPTFAGMNITASYSTNLQENQQQVFPTVVTTDADGYIFGLTFRGTWGPFYAQGDWAHVEGNKLVVGNPALVGAGVLTPKGDAYKVGGSWGYMPGARIGAIWVMTDVNNGTGQVVGIIPGQKVNQQAWTINWEHTFGNIQALAQFGWLNEMKGDGCNNSPFINGQPACNDSGATAFMVGARYFLSKRTWVYASYNQVSNDSNQYVDYTGGAITSWNGTGQLALLGADPKIWALGLFHAF